MRLSQDIGVNEAVQAVFEVKFVRVNLNGQESLVYLAMVQNFQAVEINPLAIPLAGEKIIIIVERKR